jgi:hypothetical protein
VLQQARRWFSISVEMMKKRGLAATIVVAPLHFQQEVSRDMYMRTRMTTKARDEALISNSPALHDNVSHQIDENTSIKTNYYYSPKSSLFNVHCTVWYIKAEPRWYSPAYPAGHRYPRATRRSARSPPGYNMVFPQRLRKI